jgi:RNA 2',3'-cyclic 3'-phosphodiesterase
MRLFVAVRLGKDVIEELAKESIRLKGILHGARWTSPDSWHITLQFLGDTSAAQFAKLETQLGTVSAPAFTLRLTSLGFFDRAGVIFLEVASSEKLLALHKQVAAATAQCGFSTEDRPYHPHITLARVRNAQRAHIRRALDSARRDAPRFRGWVAREFVLFESFLGRDGARYEVRTNFPLTAAETPMRE